MTGVKRPAEEPLSLVHPIKQARISKTRFDGDTASPSEPGLMEEWKGWGWNFVSLVGKTAHQAGRATTRLKRRLIRWSSVPVSPTPLPVTSPTLPPITSPTLPPIISSTLPPVAPPTLASAPSPIFSTVPSYFRGWLPLWLSRAPEARVVNRTGEALPAENQLVQDLECSTKGPLQSVLEEQRQTEQEDTWPRTDIGVPPYSDVKLRLQQSSQHKSQGPEIASDASSHTLAFDTSLFKIESTETRRLTSEQIDLLSQSSLLSESASSLTSQFNNSQTRPHGHPPKFLLGYSPTVGLDASLAAPPRKIKLATKQGKQRPYKKRQHILQNVHEAKVRAARLKQREEMINFLFERKRAQGYSSSLQDFKDLLDYGQVVEQAVNGIASTTTRGSSTAAVPSPSEDENFLSFYIKTARKTVNSPRPPKAFAPNLDQMQISERVKDQAIESRLRPSRPSLPSQLPSQDDAVVSNILKKRGTVAKFAREQVTDQDIDRLKPGKWLNDELINFYGAMILARSDGCKENSATNGQGTPLNVHFFSTFFWTKLTKEGYEKARLAKWTKKIDIFSKDVILIPVNHNNAHWTAGAINFRKKRIESYDSMGMAKEQVFKHLRAYLDAEHRNKKKKEFDFIGWENWAPDDTPQQENGYDCGVFTCQFLQALSQGQDFFIFTQKDMPYLRRRMIWEIGNARLRDD